MDMKSFRVVAKDDGPAEVLIYGDIGAEEFFGGIGAEEIYHELKALKNEDILLRINSNGGDVFEGLAIYNHLKDYGGRVDVVVDGLAASAASVIAMAGDSIHMNRGAQMMIHNSWMVTVGDKDEHAISNKWLSKVDADMVDLYAARTGQTSDAVISWMKETTYFSDTEAMAFGFADTNTKAPAIAAFGGDWMAYVPHLLSKAHARGFAKTIEHKPITKQVADSVAAAYRKSIPLRFGSR